MDQRNALKPLVTLLTVLITTLSCQSISTDKQILNEVINKYENYEAYDREKFPLGDFSEARYEQFYSFCKQQTIELDQVDREKLERDDQRSYDLIRFALKNHLSHFEFKQH